MPEAAEQQQQQQQQQQGAKQDAASSAEQPIGLWVEALAAKTPTPGGGGAAAVAAAIGAASAAMAAIHTTRKKDEEAKDEIHGSVAAKARKISGDLTASARRLIAVADDDAEAYRALQATWKDKTMAEEEKKAREARALEVPVDLVRQCHAQAALVVDFLPQCNKMIISDAHVALHLLAGAARAAYQTVLVNSPPEALKSELRGLLDELSTFEAKVLPASNPQ